MAIFIAEDFRSLLDAIDAVEETDVENTEVVNEDGQMTKIQAVKILSQLRGIAKQSETGAPLPGGFASQLANDLWPVISWLDDLQIPAPQAAPPQAAAPQQTQQTQQSVH